MKKPIFLFSVMSVLVFFFFGCGNGEEQASEPQDPEATVEKAVEETVEETVEVDHTAAMMDVLKEMNITIPEELQYDRGGENYIYFSTDAATEELKEKLDDYYMQVRTDLKAAGWEEEVLEENLDLGGISNRTAFEKSNRGKKIFVGTKYFDYSSSYELSFKYIP